MIIIQPQIVILEKPLSRYLPLLKGTQPLIFLLSYPEQFWSLINIRYKTNLKAKYLIFKKTFSNNPKVPLPLKNWVLIFERHFCSGKSLFKNRIFSFQICHLSYVDQWPKLLRIEKWKYKWLSPFKKLWKNTTKICLNKWLKISKYSHLSLYINLIQLI